MALPLQPSGANRIQKLPRRVARMLRRWSMGKDGNDKIARWQDLSNTGDAIAQTIASDGWTVVEDAKRFCQDRAEMCVRTAQMSEDVRLRAAIELSVLDNFFRELRSRVREGHVAREALTKVQEPRTMPSETTHTTN